MGMSASRQGGVDPRGGNMSGPVGMTVPTVPTGLPQTPQATPAGQPNPFDAYPRLQHALHNGPFGGVFAAALMNAMEHNRQQSGMSVPDWTNYIATRNAARHGQV